ncbi:polyprenol phosphomannose-dependent alpha 1,6 mannosyltransferase MptB [Galbibacter mesophilus]|uniref:polyprenol phosphomannose-dependent alpha 1,6 mannosyltransferase MptB n=1 Tax=Galbibacter mesophilus TaxID=379069 RepID=UPI00191EA0E4|nr:polyprenol phosphomannose-dependent alpha 1,6 mannosyltransferase MptB [Galbibacter mesophilus]MCM5661968.1 polyprenol phosphomannose-dependent alpha 1,6 mannosyltransferase MptB [Galbibacter mesophilus]
MIRIWKTNKYTILFLIASLLFYGSFAYDLVRTDFIKLLSLCVALFFFAYKLIQFEKSNLRFLLIFGILARLVFFAATPNLSQDFYRFIWDGKLLVEGVNPYLHTPMELIGSEGFSTQFLETLFEGMGTLSASNHSNYPPINQLFFYLGNVIGGKNILVNIIVLRFFIILADVGIFYFGSKILQLLKLPKQQIHWYFLNPLIIIELTGNLHFEAIMLFFLVAALYFILQNKWIFGAVLFSFSISVKLLPLLLLPLFIRWFIKDTDKRSMLRLGSFYLLVGLVFLISFLPFLSAEMIEHYSETVGLWFKKFEFNASIYYLVREIGFYHKGFNIISIAGTRLAFLTLAAILLLAFFRKNNQPKTLFVSMLMAVSIYFFMSTTVHPWYLATPVLLCVFTRYKFPLIWSLAVFLSYFAYSNEFFVENPWIITTEYLIVFGCFLKEVYLEKPILKGI